MLATLTVLAVLGCAGILFAPALVRQFQSDPEVLRIGSPALRFACLSLFFVTLNLTPSMLLQTCGFKKAALFTACLRGGLCLIPLAFALPRIFGLIGVQLAQPLADVISSLATFPFALRFFRALPREDLHVAADDAA